MLIGEGRLGNFRWLLCICDNICFAAVDSSFTLMITLQQEHQQPYFKILELGGPFSNSCVRTPILGLLGCLLYNRYFGLRFIRLQVLASRFSHKILWPRVGGRGVKFSWIRSTTTTICIHTFPDFFSGFSRFIWTYPLLDPDFPDFPNIP